jgi:hypothetical protein
MAYCSDADPDSGVTIQLHAVSDNTWTETTITWDNKPDYGSLLDTNNTTVGWNKWVIGKANIQTNGPMSFMLMMSSGVEASLYSKDNATNRPYLLVTTPPSGAAIDLLLLSD